MGPRVVPWIAAALAALPIALSFSLLGKPEFVVAELLSVTVAVVVLLTAALLRRLMIDSVDLRRHLGEVDATLRTLREGEARCSDLVERAMSRIVDVARTVEDEHVIVSTLSASLAEVHVLLSPLSSSLAEVKEHLAEVRKQVERERRNLGMIAGGLDDVRRTTSGMELLSARCEALADSLVMVAERVDAALRTEAPSALPTGVCGA